MKKIILIVLVAGLIFAGFRLIQSKKKEQNNQPTAFISQEILKPQIETRKNDSFEYFQAKSEAILNPKIATKISGYIENIKVKENQVVQKGEILVQIETNEYQNNLKQSQYLIQSSKKNIESLKLSLESLKLDSDLAKTQYETNQKLYQIGGIAKEKLEFSNINFKQKESKYQSTLESIKAKEYELQSITASLASKESLESYYTLKSPINGRVEKILLDIGDLANPNQSIITLVSNEKKLTFSYASDAIKPHQEVFLEDEKIGYIDFISPSSENFLQVATIKLTKKLDITNNTLVSIKVKIK